MRCCAVAAAVLLSAELSVAYRPAGRSSLVEVTEDATLLEARENASEAAALNCGSPDKSLPNLEKCQRCVKVAPGQCGFCPETGKCSESCPLKAEDKCAQADPWGEAVEEIFRDWAVMPASRYEDFITCVEWALGRPFTHLNLYSNIEGDTGKGRWACQSALVRIGVMGSVGRLAHVTSDPGQKGNCTADDGCWYGDRTEWTPKLCQLLTSKGKSCYIRSWGISEFAAVRGLSANLDDRLVKQFSEHPITPMNPGAGKSGSGFGTLGDAHFKVKIKLRYSSTDFSVSEPKALMQLMYKDAMKNHLQSNPNTLLNRIHMLLKLKVTEGLYIIILDDAFHHMDTRASTAKREYAKVNVPVSFNRYDLKGPSRNQEREKVDGFCLENGDFRKVEHDWLRLRDDHCSQLRSAVDADVAFLQKYQLVDYSLLVVSVLRPLPEPGALALAEGSYVFAVGSSVLYRGSSGKYLPMTVTGYDGKYDLTGKKNANSDAVFAQNMDVKGNRLCHLRVVNPPAARRSSSSGEAASALGGDEAWPPAAGAEQEAWLQIDVQDDQGREPAVMGVLLEGSPDGSNCVTQFQVQYSKDGSSWNSLASEAGFLFSSPFGCGAGKQLMAVANRRFLARYVRIGVKAWNGAPSVRAAVVVCGRVPTDAGQLACQDAGVAAPHCMDQQRHLYTFSIIDYLNNLVWYKEWETNKYGKKFDEYHRQISSLARKICPLEEERLLRSVFQQCMALLSKGDTRRAFEMMGGSVSAKGSALTQEQVKTYVDLCGNRYPVLDTPDLGLDVVEWQSIQPERMFSAIDIEGKGSVDFQAFDYLLA